MSFELLNVSYTGKKRVRRWLRRDQKPHGLNISYTGKKRVRKWLRRDQNHMDSHHPARFGNL